ncbi:PhzF family phenazine biosynthesis protein [Actinoplanes derwentensis]|uniref:Phenazine biosynthesis protein PhzF family n=1 Tax=Actinoplanes derwentensis TaxID=113562 RepID=A0A1H2D483_9ACTN|nr:PhzF family phenazine biosynthesis protein [Actinoplanes derwentensis]GID85946.1 oxidoreductase [Actinoplanes derwentensis]SDT77292.1 phenazine biosynthesis protein PhzF family [Actinoplanes derwentensis]
MRIRIVDAFTDRPFTGAPAGVVVLDGDGFPPDQWMQRVAAEVNHAETAFLHRLPAGSAADWALRWFTPAAEVALCGHATLATSHVLDRAGLIGGWVGYQTRSGVLTASADSDGLITLDFPTAPLSRVEPDPELIAALGVTPLTVLHTGPFTDDLLFEVADENTVRGLDPDLRAVARLTRRGVIVTALAAEHGSGYDFVSRFFAPAVGVDEDPVTGSAHTALTPFWAARLDRTELTGYQASRRGGHVRVALHGDRTHLSGHAVTTIDGDLLV